MANRYIRASGGNSNTAATYESAPGANDSVALPTSADVVIGHASSGQYTVNAAITVGGLDLSAYTATLTINTSQIFTVAGNVTLSASMTLAGSGTLSMTVTSTITSAGKAITWATSFPNSITITVTGALQLNGAVSISGNPVTFNGSQISFGGNVTLGGSTAGTSTYVYNGTGTWNGSNNLARRLGAGIEINTSGTLTMSASGGMNFGSTATYTAGTVVNSGTCFVSQNTTLSGAWPALIITTLATCTLTLDNTAAHNFIVQNHNLTVSGAKTTGSLTFNNVAQGTFTRGVSGAWSFSTVTVNAGCIGAIAGAQDADAASLVVQVGGTFIFTSGQTFTISGTSKLNGASYVTTTVRAATASSAFTLARGTVAIEADYITITDVTVTGSKLWNYQGATLTRVTNIGNFTTTPGDAPTPAAVSAIIPGLTLPGTPPATSEPPTATDYAWAALQGVIT